MVETNIKVDREELRREFMILIAEVSFLKVEDRTIDRLNDLLSDIDDRLNITDDCDECDDEIESEKILDECDDYEIEKILKKTFRNTLYGAKGIKNVEKISNLRNHPDIKAIQKKLENFTGGKVIIMTDEKEVVKDLEYYQKNKVEFFNRVNEIRKVGKHKFGFWGTENEFKVMPDVVFENLYITIKKDMPKEFN